MAKKKLEKYGEGLEALEKIVHSLEENNLDLDEMVDAVEKGLELAEKLKNHLEVAENKVNALKKKYQVHESDADDLV
jgi:exodeoxyribonuclease VII small subunit